MFQPLLNKKILFKFMYSNILTMNFINFIYTEMVNSFQKSSEQITNDIVEPNLKISKEKTHSNPATLKYIEHASSIIPDKIKEIMTIGQIIIKIKTKLIEEIAIQTGIKLSVYDLHKTLDNPKYTESHPILKNVLIAYDNLLPEVLKIKKYLDNLTTEHPLWVTVNQLFNKFEAPYKIEKSLLLERYSAIVAALSFYDSTSASLKTLS
ncbi:hypothetical protein NUSPORA_01604 [Nucleospora cyclopteri]